MSTSDAGSGTSPDVGPGPTAGAGRRGRPSRRAMVAALGAVAGALVAVGVAVGVGDGGDDAAGAGTPAATTTPSPRPSGTPSPSATPSTSPTPTPTVSAGPAAAEPAAPAPAEDDLPPGLEVVQPGVVPELPPVALDEPADFGTAVTARLVTVERVEGEGQGLGEESGPAVAVTVEMHNSTPEPVDLDFVVVNLEDANGDPGQSLFGDPRSAPFGGALAPGASRTATYVLRLPSADTAAVSVTVSYGAQAPTAVFSGPVPPPGTSG